MAYSDLSANWSYKTLVKASDLNQLGENDEWIRDNKIDGVTGDNTLRFFTGTIAHGGTIALPSGWTTILFAYVSPNQLGSSSFSTEYMLYVECSVNQSTFAVVCRSLHASGSPTYINGTANYLIIGY